MRNTDVDVDVDVDAIALWRRAVYLLEPDGRALPDRVDERILRFFGACLIGIARHRLPKWSNAGGALGIDCNFQGLD